MKMEFVIANPKNKYYQEALKKEIRCMNGVVPQWPPSIDLHPIVNSYNNQEIMGSKSSGETNWYNIVTTRFEAVEKGLSLGTGTGRHERVLLEKGFLKKWNCIDLSTTSRELLQADTQKNNVVETNDLNFIQLPDKEYPIVFCHGILHHIINLEHLLFEINRTLTDDGLFIVSEYVGEDKWQWEDEKLQIINTKLLNKFGSKYPKLKVNRPPIWNERPLESIRSSAIPNLLKEYFGNTTEFEILSSPVLYPIINSIKGEFRNELINNPESLEEILEFAVSLDKECVAQYKHLLPTSLIGIYRKSKIKSPIPARPWTNQEIRYQLASHLPLHRRLRRYFGRFERLRRAYWFLERVLIKK